MKGNKPKPTNVTPLRGDGSEAERFEKQGNEIAAKLKPHFIDPDADMIWDRMAPALANPLVARLKPSTVESFKLLCNEIARMERLQVEIGFEADGEVYVTTTRNGLQHKARPEVAQINDTKRFALTIMRDFGMTPASERSVSAPTQGDLPFDDFD